MEREGKFSFSRWQGGPTEKVKPREHVKKVKVKAMWLSGKAFQAKCLGCLRNSKEIIMAGRE